MDMRTLAKVVLAAGLFWMGVQIAPAADPPVAADIVKLDSAPRPTINVVRPKGHEGAPSWPLGLSKVAEPHFLKSLRGGTPLKQDNPPTASHQERDHAAQPRDFVQQPPLIPHTTSNYQITKNFNKCMDCHAWTKATAAGATKVGLTHFRDREGMELDNVSPRRYFCTACHVAQTDAKALVENTFQRARGLQ